MNIIESQNKSPNKINKKISDLGLSILSLISDNPGIKVPEMFETISRTDVEISIDKIRYSIKTELKETIELKGSKKQAAIILNNKTHQEKTKMIRIENLESLAEENLDKNLKFRAYLKNHADPEELDEQFKKLHKKYFAIYDCNKCRNCCIKLKGTIPECDLKRDAEYMGITVEEFKNKYLDDKQSNHEYETINCPCNFFDGKECVLGDCKPETCKAYPHTNKDNRLASMWSIIDNTAICPIVYEIIEELKQIYNFR